MKTLAVIQARMASARLPGKVMKTLGSKRAIGWATSAAIRTPGVDSVVVATSINPENDVLAGWCHTNDIRCFRGSEDDVLGRYCSLIAEYNPVDIVRLTGDCPLLDSHVIASVIGLHQASGSSYTTNQWPPTWPDGLDTEVISAKALLQAGKEATDSIDRDTVTQFIWRNQSRWPSYNLSCPVPNLEEERWVLDSPQDYELLKLIVEAFPDDWQPNYLDIWHHLNANPSLRKINTQWIRNQRFYEELAEQPPPEKLYTRTKKQLYRALKVIPNASQTFSKSCRQFPRDESPLFASHGDGAYIFDIDGNRFVDLVGALLPNILGYNDPAVNFAIRRQLDRGISLSLATEIEADLAETLVQLIPCAEAVRLGKNGSDATSGAVRLARHFTDRDRIGIIAGEGYHGWHDWAVANTHRDAGVPGLVKSLTRRLEPHIHTVVEELSRHRYAAVIIDPENHDIAFLEGLREECTNTGSVLIFDEIRTGFRYALGGYQEYIGVIPDLSCFGKSIANGMPISALVGKKGIMEGLGTKDGPFWSGTFFGESLSIAAAIATIDKLKSHNVIEYLWTIGQQIADEVDAMLYQKGIEDIKVVGEDARAILEFKDDGIRDKFMRSMIAEGVLVINSHNLSFAMGPNEVDRVINAYRKVLS